MTKHPICQIALLHKGQSSCEPCCMWKYCFPKCLGLGSNGHIQWKVRTCSCFALSLWNSREFPGGGYRQLSGTEKMTWKSKREREKGKKRKPPQTAVHPLLIFFFLKLCSSSSRVGVRTEGKYIFLCPSVLMGWRQEAAAAVRWQRKNKREEGKWAEMTAWMLILCSMRLV